MYRVEKVRWSGRVRAIMQWSESRRGTPEDSSDHGAIESGRSLAGFGAVKTRPRRDPIHDRSMFT